MYSLHFKYSSQASGFKGIILDKISIKDKANNKFTSWVIGIVADYDSKDTVKDFCKKRGGTWHPVKKYWYFPVKIRNDNEAPSIIWESCKAIIDEFQDCILCGGLVNLSFDSEELKSESKQEKLKAKILALVEIENSRLTLKNHWVSTVDDNHAHEYRGDEGEYRGTVELDNGKRQKVVVHGEEKPQDFDKQHNEYDGYADYRQFLAEDGKQYWCLPYSENYWDFAWDDVVASSPKSQAEKPQAKVAEDTIEDSAPMRQEAPILETAMKISLVFNKQGESVCFRVQFFGQIGFNRLLHNFKVYVPGRKWNADKKAWDVPIDSADELLDYAKGSSWIEKEGCCVEFTQNASELLGVINVETTK
jgi:hypothetical protein